MTLDHIHGHTYHGRKGAVKNAFRYGVDYVLTDFSKDRGPSLFSRNRFNLAALFDRDHGGIRGNGIGVEWVRGVLRNHGFAHLLEGRIELLAQPRIWGHVFNPVSFWLIYDSDDALGLVIAEVNNTFGDRHSYLCFNDDKSPIDRDDVLEAEKIFHVSPFQDVAGHYKFRFHISDKSVEIWIDYLNGNKGLIATYVGDRQPLSNRSILVAAIKRPFGSIRVLALIHWQAIKLKIKGAVFRPRPLPPVEEISR
ncbi:MAG: DUF1365 domain-containing protein [Pseudomonadota bacterium]